MHVLIADDHRLVIEGVKLKMTELAESVDFTVAMTAQELMNVLAKADVDYGLALLDLSIPGANGLSHIEQVRKEHPALPVVVLSGSEDADLMRRLLDLGVLGFIPKAYSPDVMLSAVRLVLSGGVYIPPMMLGQVSAAAPVAAPAVASPESIDSLRRILTERQVDVLRLLSQGKPNKLIARDLGISEGTVKIHLAAIYRALNVRNRTEAVVASRKLEGI
ncbi:MULTISPECIES: LuxR C-terminal-related transcriptional regulator [Hydrocarboniphaga]|uniref:Two component LuxR family transcriptional regulator n=1 Tax=Hydrocarboniphaga effusa AP103 TaxID=1172194 RepID=I7ZCE0_9GAMM|nr:MULTISPECIES: response regulator transcription factor [Hydrocarboniphaga]EIT69347.1 two component LuxR family transcriptional regulator [Hydrocarboniphaga effusa AP103]MDZ4078386.1 response regulator transcription factor [Hydrocarboniphaga sp.]